MPAPGPARVTLTLDDDLGARLEELARQSRRSLEVVVHEVLRRGLDAKTPHTKPFEVRAYDMGLRPGVQLDYIGELLEQLDGPVHK